MRFSVLHISDLHRDLHDEINNKWLVDSLENDFNQFESQEPKITRPSLCIVSGDLVYGVHLEKPDASKKLERQYAQAEEFLIALADKFFNGCRDRIVIVPGNHDVFYTEAVAVNIKLRYLQPR